MPAVVSGRKTVGVVSSVLVRRGVRDALFRSGATAVSCRTLPLCTGKCPQTPYRIDASEIRTMKSLDYRNTTTKIVRSV